ncbi:hypothetical protein [Streptomyces poonensis]|nr:hypothetical protein [Streptomyces poonensis]
MRAKADDGEEKADDGEEREGGGGRGNKLDLSLPQVAGSAVAAVVAARLASYFGVYGTILGAGVVSVIATCGGTVLQHFLRRTGEQLRDAAAQTRPAEQPVRAPGEFGAATVHRARARGRRRPVIAAAVVFGVTMAGITTYELVSGTGLGGGNSTTVGDALSGHNKPSSSDDPGSSGSSDSTDSTDPTDSTGSTDDSGSPDSPGAVEDGGPSSTTPSATSGGTPTDGASAEDGGSGTEGSPAPDATESSAGEEPGADPAPSASATSPAPSADSRSGTADPDRAGSAAP